MGQIWHYSIAYKVACLIRLYTRHIQVEVLYLYYGMFKYMVCLPSSVCWWNSQKSFCILRQSDCQAWLWAMIRVMEVHGLTKRGAASGDDNGWGYAYFTSGNWCETAWTGIITWIQPIRMTLFQISSPIPLQLRSCNFARGFNKIRSRRLVREEWPTAWTRGKTLKK